MKKITIAIDGFSSCGKSTMAKDLAKKIKIKKINDAENYIVDAYKKYARRGKYIEEIFNDEKDRL